jgi:hypothetical protein
LNSAAVIEWQTALGASVAAGEDTRQVWVACAIYATPDKKPAPPRRVNLNLEKLRVFWGLVCDRRWISQQQLLYVSQRLDVIGRMVGGWLKQVTHTPRSRPHLSNRPASHLNLRRPGREMVNPTKSH